MKRFIFAIALLMTSLSGFAQNPPHPPIEVRKSEVRVNSAVKNDSLATAQVLKGSYFVHGTQNGVFFAANEFTAVDNLLTIECPGASGTCTIVADMWVQTGADFTISNPSDNYAVCLYVDGVNVDTADGTRGCHYTANTPSDGTFVEGGEENSLSGVTVGNHTVQTFLWTDDGTPVYNYNISYHVYKP